MDLSGSEAQVFCAPDKVAEANYSSSSVRCQDLSGL
jgi:hypothetical protein